MTPASTNTTRDIATAAPGDIHESRSCETNCASYSLGKCQRHGWDLASMRIARCTSHKTVGEHRFGLARPHAPVDAPSPAGTSAAWLDALAWMEHVVKTEGESALHTPENEIKFARLLLIAPNNYYDILEKTAPGSAEQWRNWARGCVERHDHADFFEALRRIGEAVDRHGHDAVHGNPEYAGLFIRAFEMAPPRYRAVAEAILAPVIPKATHVNSAGEPVYSPEQIAEKLGVTVEDIRVFVDEHVDPSRLYTGAVHPIQ